MLMMGMLAIITGGDEKGSFRRASCRRESALSLRKAVVALVALLMAGYAGHGHAAPTLREEVHLPIDKRSCQVDDLLPGYTMADDLSELWDENTLVKPPFDCTCNTLKASYFCPSLGNKGYPKWMPEAVARRECRPVSRDGLKHKPLPSGFKVLFYGNSHLRQVLEGIVCAFSRSVSRRRVTVTGENSMIPQDVIVEPALHCRSCSGSRRSMTKFLVENGCVSKDSTDDACWCDDNNSVFEFSNKAIIHYHFAHKEDDKRIEDALRVHNTDFSDYDAVVANLGNELRMTVNNTLLSAARLHDEGVPFFWLTTYDGKGDILEWSPSQQETFQSLGAKFLPVHRMVETLKYLTKGVVEGGINPHFCMPGPPNEIGILLLKIFHALNEQR